MCRSLYSSLVVAVALGGSFLCVGEEAPPGELPVRAVEIRPDGAWVWRQGVVDASGQVLGLPAGFQLSRSRLAVAGEGPPLMPRLGYQYGPLQGPGPDADAMDEGESETENKSESAGFDLFGDGGTQGDAAFVQRMQRRAAWERELAVLEDDEQHVRLQLERVQSLGRGDAEELTPRYEGSRPAHPPTANQLTAAMDFIEKEQRRLLAALSAIVDRREALQREWTELDRSLEKPSAPRALMVPAAAGRRLSVVHPLDGLRWAPSYRIRVVGDRAHLVREALIDADLDDDLTVERLTLHGSPALGNLAPPRIDVRHLSVADVLAPDEQRQTARSREVEDPNLRGSESAVWQSGRLLVRLQRSDGSWGDNPYRNRTSAIVVLTMLGAGYDHRTPNAYRRVIQRGLAYLQKNEAMSDSLPAQALITRALTEAYLMSNDEQLLPVVKRAMDHLAALANTEGKLQGALRRRGPLEGPVALALTAMAVTSLKAAGLSADTATITDSLKAMNAHWPHYRDQVLAGLVQTTIKVMQGEEVFPDYSSQYVKMVEAWHAQSPEWIEAGQVERVLFATLVLFQAGGEYWQGWNGVHRDRMVALLQRVQGGEHVNAAIPHALGPAAALALAEMSLQIYYRYVPLRADRPHPPQSIARPRLANVREALGDWPLILDVGAVTLKAGQGLRRLRVDEHPLPGEMILTAVPAVNPGVWRVLHTSNPLPGVLAVAEADVVVDDLPIGSTQLPLVAPGESLRLELGRDERFHVQRSVSREQREVGGRLVHTVTIALTVHGPDGVTVQLQEALPRPASPEVRLRSLEPAWSDDRLDRALHEDPRWLIPLTPRDGVASARIQYELRHPADLRLQHITRGDQP